MCSRSLSSPVIGSVGKPLAMLAMGANSRPVNSFMTGARIRILCCIRGIPKIGTDEPQPTQGEAVELVLNRECTSTVKSIAFSRPHQVATIGHRGRGRSKRQDDKARLTPRLCAAEHSGSLEPRMPDPNKPRLHSRQPTASNKHQHLRWSSVSQGCQSTFCATCADLATTMPAPGTSNLTAFQPMSGEA